ncbi:hypothetical protein FN846DRAFT_773514 [Sphaerosporella brunnea]|uniref:HNH nuclease domain-containing protein n=1 Tax=Sphaerosporella brunnea TaxID=1250544 RepID=A0A5J5F632_9PEZI|nr:hypothetical protein FN846DRAFT_773514 [Sphaerosporella brunnea]
MEARILDALESVKEDLRSFKEEVREQFEEVREEVRERSSALQTQVSSITYHLIEEQYECTQEELDRCNRLGTQGIILTTRTPAFRALVEARNPRCLLSGACNHPQDLTRLKGELTGPGIEAAHIVPLGRPDLWSEAMVSAVRSSRSSRVLRNAPYVDNNCVENGVMLRADLHKMFDRFFWSVHPSTRVVVAFVPIPELMAYHGMKVDRSPPGFPPGKIWQWHWEQSVIRCLRAAAEGNPEDKYYDNEPAVETIATVTVRPYSCSTRNH